jgi:hypothetical protein
MHFSTEAEPNFNILHHQGVKPLGDYQTMKRMQQLSKAPCCKKYTGNKEQ